MTTLEPGLQQPAAQGTSTIFHITHWKAGSKWVQALFRHAFAERWVEVKPDMSHVLSEPIRPGGIYSPVYLAKWSFDEAVRGPHRKFVVIRDLRDTLVSWYYSLKISHGLKATPSVADFRGRLLELDVNEGLRHLIADRLVDIANVQSSWHGSGVLTIRYEDMIADEQEAYRRVFAHCGLEMEEETRRRYVTHHNFERVTGRKPGEEDAAAHHRKGVAGDWRNHFDERTKGLFKERFGQLLIDTGYEKDLGW